MTLDEAGRERADIFYKAAFYDRSAHMNFRCRYLLSTHGDTCYDPPHDDPGEKKRRRGVIRDSTTDEVLFATPWTEPVEYLDWKEEEVITATLRAWAEEHYPDYLDPAAYW